MSTLIHMPLASACVCVRVCACTCSLFQVGKSFCRQFSARPAPERSVGHTFSLTACVYPVRCYRRACNCEKKFAYNSYIHVHIYVHILCHDGVYGKVIYLHCRLILTTGYLTVIYLCFHLVSLCCRINYAIKMSQQLKSCSALNCINCNNYRGRATVATATAIATTTATVAIANCNVRPLQQFVLQLTTT